MFAATSDGTTQLESIDGFEAPEDMLSAWGPEGVKLQLKLRGLKCGGTPLSRAQRLLAVKGLTRMEYPPKLLAKV